MVPFLSYIGFVFVKNKFSTNETVWMTLSFLGLNMQAMDSSSVCLVQMELNADSFDPYRCDKNITLGIDLKK